MKRDRQPRASYARLISGTTAPRSRYAFVPASPTYLRDVDTREQERHVRAAHLRGPMWMIPDINRGRLTEVPYRPPALWSPLRQNVDSVTSRRWWGSPSRSSSHHATDGS
jgi:hypothetical protein